MIHDGIRAGADIIDALADRLCGPGCETRTSPHADMSPGRERAFHLRRRGVDWGDNDRSFQAQYMLLVSGGMASSGGVASRSK